MDASSDMTFDHDSHQQDFLLEPSTSSVWLSFFVVFLYKTIGFAIFEISGNFKAVTTFKVIVGFGILGLLLTQCANYVYDKRLKLWLDMMDENRCQKIFRQNADKEKESLRIRTKVCLALVVIIGVIALGTVILHFVERLDWIDSIYFTIISGTSGGYGNYSFQTITGRCFAITWLLISSLLPAKAFIYLTDYRMCKRTSNMAKIWFALNEEVLA